MATRALAEASVGRSVSELPARCRPVVLQRTGSAFGRTKDVCVIGIGIRRMSANRIASSESDYVAQTPKSAPCPGATKSPHRRFFDTERPGGATSQARFALQPGRGTQGRQPESDWWGTARCGAGPPFRLAVSNSLTQSRLAFGRGRCREAVLGGRSSGRVVEQAPTPEQPGPGLTQLVQLACSGTH